MATTPSVGMLMFRPLFTAAFLVAGVAACGDAGCSNEVVARVPAPDRSRDAVVFDRACGATTGYSRQVSIVDSGAAPRGRGNVFIARFQVPVTATWTGPRALEVRYRADAQPLHRSDAWGVRVQFRAQEPLTTK